MATSGRKRKREVQDVKKSPPRNSVENGRKKQKVSISPDNRSKVADLEFNKYGPRQNKAQGFQRCLSFRSTRRSLRSLALASWNSKEAEGSPKSAKSMEALNEQDAPFANELQKPSTFKRSESFRKLRKPIVNLRGSMRQKLTDQLKKNAMKGKQDYTLPMSTVTGQMDYLMFLGAMQKHEEEEEKGMTSGSRLSQQGSSTDSVPHVPSVVEDMDLFYYRQLARTLKDHELQQKIDFEIKMRDGTAKLLAASRHPHQLLEAAKNLLTSNTRMIAYMGELQRRKTDEVMKRKTTDLKPKPCKGRICMSNIRVPLMWKDSDYFKNKGDHRRFAVFCLLKIGTEIYDTALVKDVDRSMTDITFEDVLVFNNIIPDFELKVEVYSHRLCDDLSIASTPKKIKKKINAISSSVGRSVGRRLSGLREDPEFLGNMIVGPKFECIAEATLGLKDIGENITTHDLTFDSANVDTHTDLPLFGNFCCRLAAQPYCLNEVIKVGSFRAKHSTEGDFEDYWGTMKAGQLVCMGASSSGDNEDSPPLAIPINKNSEIRKLSLNGSTCIEVINYNLMLKTSYILSFEDNKELDAWYSSLTQHVFDHESWQHVAEKHMCVQMATPQRAPVFLRKATNSVYDNTGVDSPMTLVLKRLNVNSKTPTKMSATSTDTGLSENEVSSSVASSGESNENLPLESQAIPKSRTLSSLSSSVSSTEGSLFNEDRNNCLRRSNRSQRSNRSLRSVSSAGSSSIDENDEQLLERHRSGLSERNVESETYICKKTGVQLRKPKITNV